MIEGHKRDAFALVEFLYGTRQTAEVGGVGWLREIITELKFIITCVGNTKVMFNIDFNV